MIGRDLMHVSVFSSQFEVSALLFVPHSHTVFPKSTFNAIFMSVSVVGGDVVLH